MSRRNWSKSLKALILPNQIRSKNKEARFIEAGLLVLWLKKKP